MTDKELEKLIEELLVINPTKSSFYAIKAVLLNTYFPIDGSLKSGKMFIKGKLEDVIITPEFVKSQWSLYNRFHKQSNTDANFIVGCDKFMSDYENYLLKTWETKDEFKDWNIEDFTI